MDDSHRIDAPCYSVRSLSMIPNGLGCRVSSIYENHRCLGRVANQGWWKRAMSDQKKQAAKPQFPEQFPTSATPVFVRYGILVGVLVALVLYVYLQGRPEAPVTTPVKSPLDAADEENPSAQPTADEEKLPLNG